MALFLSVVAVKDGRAITAKIQVRTISASSDGALHICSCLEGRQGYNCQDPGKNHKKKKET